MTSQIRVDEITNRSGLGTVTIYDNGFEFTGVTTFTEDVDITGGLTIGGVLTYEDVTNIDSVGVITARNGLNVTGGNIGIGENNPQNSLHISGSAPAIRFVDSGANGSAFSIIEDNNGLLKIRNDAGNSGTGSGIAFEVDAAERLRIDDVGRLLIGRTTALASSAERLTIDSGMAMFRRNSTNAAALYIRNEDSTADTRHPYLIFADGSGNRGGFGIQNDSSSLWISGQNGIAFRTSGSVPSQEERLRITSDGKMGLGISSPARGGLHIHKAATAELHLTDDTTGSGSGDGFTLFSTSSSAGVWYRENAPLRFATYNTERLRITSDGNVGVKVTNPDLTLHVNGVNALPSTSGSTPTGHLTLRNKAGGSSHGMFMGVSNASPWSSWIQAQDVNNNATNYPLLLNPNGGSIGIGTNNPEGQLHLNGTTRYVQTISATNGVTAGTTSGTIYRQQYTNDSTSRRMGFFGIKRSAGSGDQRAKFVMELCPDNSTNLGLSSPANNTTAFQFNYNGTMWVKSGGGIDFSQTSDATGSTSELLDDYEEGTFTAVLRSHSTNTTTTGYDTSTNASTANYTKVGRLVTINMEWNNLHNDARAHVLRYIDGLPFTSSSTNRSTAAIGYQRGLYFRYSSSGETTNNHHLYGTIEGNTTQVALNGSKGSSPYSGWPTTHDSSSSMYLGLSMQYYV